MTKTISSFNEYSLSKPSSSVDLKDLVTEIVSSYVANNQIDKEEIPELFQMVFQSLSSLTYRKGGLLTSTSEPAIPIEDSIHPDYLTCLEDGRQLKMLKRHLRTAYNMSPEQYRLRWNLPDNYPMVAPNYSKHRSQLAKDGNLGIRNTGR
ncbi:MucR family transcriptional regulator [Geitlerinema splendidum]|nr:MucR family transcriptional regulator [Geitlerinema splendidum]